MSAVPSPAILLSAENRAHTLAVLGGRSVLRVFIQAAAGTVASEAGPLQAVETSAADQQFIADTLAALDGRIGLDFALTGDAASADLRIVQVGEASGNGADFSGLAIPQANGWILQWQATSRRGGVDPAQPLSAYDRHTLIHEIGHVLGLSHPGDNPFDSRWDTAATVMSYLPTAAGWSTTYSRADLAALQQVWQPQTAGRTSYEAFTSAWSGTIGIERRLTAAAGGSRLKGGNRSGGAGDVLIGAGGPDVLLGRNGSDWLIGGGGNDQLEGGNGWDLLDGGPGRDVLSGQGGLNTYASQRDGDEDVFQIQAEGNGRQVDVIEAMDRFDRLEVLGFASEDLRVEQRVRFRELQGFGVYAGKELVALVLDDTLTQRQLQQTLLGAAEVLA